MFVIDWFWDVLGYLGLWQKCGKLLLLGLDNAGKTTLLHMLRDNRVVAHAPTQRATKETLTLDRVVFECHDLGGHVGARDVWADYYVDASVIVFLVDAADAARFDEARDELTALLTDPRLADVPVLVLGNKIDLPRAASEAALRAALGLGTHLTTGKGGAALPDRMRPVEVFMCSVVNRAGYADGFRWVAQFL
jgi:GTP-binding protein SAR1